MSDDVKVGISDIAAYLPRLKIALRDVIERRALQQDGVKVSKLLRRALEKTGLDSLHFPETWEDSVTMAAEAALRLIEAKRVSLPGLRYLVTGTETSVDHSKPISAYVSGMLRKAGIDLPHTLSSFQLQHACAGGTLAILAVAALLSANGQGDESGIVICSDIARYQAMTSAEVTQGAGAVAILVETSPKLIELDLKTVGYCSHDVDDFFRPLDSKIAKVKGGFSVRCYKEAMESALLDHARRANREPEEVLLSADMFALHVPYPTLPADTMHYLLRRYTSLAEESFNDFLEERGFFAMTHPASLSGNIYSGSMYLSLAFLLQERYKRFGSAIIGKKILLGSYGSGNTLAFITGRIAENAPSVIASWDLEALWSTQEASFDHYERWVSSHETGFDELLKSEVAPLGFYLHQIREDGYREYLVQK